MSGRIASPEELMGILNILAEEEERAREVAAFRRRGDVGQVMGAMPYPFQPHDPQDAHERNPLRLHESLRGADREDSDVVTELLRLFESPPIAGISRGLAAGIEGRPVMGAVGDMTGESPEMWQFLEEQGWNPWLARGAEFAVPTMFSAAGDVIDLLRVAPAALGFLAGIPRGMQRMLASRIDPALIGPDRLPIQQYHGTPVAFRDPPIRAPNEGSPGAGHHTTPIPRSASNYASDYGPAPNVRMETPAIRRMTVDAESGLPTRPLTDTEFERIATDIRQYSVDGVDQRDIDYALEVLSRNRDHLTIDNIAEISRRLARGPIEAGDIPIYQQAYYKTQMQADILDGLGVRGYAGSHGPHYNEFLTFFPEEDLIRANHPEDAVRWLTRQGDLTPDEMSELAGLASGRITEVNPRSLLDLRGNELRYSPAETSALRQQIEAAGGVLEPVQLVFDRTTGRMKLGDGNHRAFAAAELGYDVPTVVVEGAVRGNEGSAIAADILQRVPADRLPNASELGLRMQSSQASANYMPTLDRVAQQSGFDDFVQFWNRAEITLGPDRARDAVLTQSGLLPQELEDMLQLLDLIGAQ